MTETGSSKTGAGTDELNIFVQVEIPWITVKKERARLLRSARKNTAVRGFRKGRAPIKILAGMYEKELREHLAEGLIRGAVVTEAQQRAREGSFELASGPYLRPWELRERRPLLVQAEFERFPDFDLQGYDGIQVPVLHRQVTDADVDQQLERLRYQHASLRNVDARPIRRGDLAAVHVVRLEGGLPVGGSGMQLTLHVGQGAQPELEQAADGLGIGDVFEYQSSRPPGEAAESQPASYRGRILGIQEVDLPDLDDDLALDVGHGLTTLEELKGRIRQELRQHLSTQTTQEAISEVRTLLSALHPIPLPKRYLKQRVQQFQKHVAASNGDNLPPTMDVEKAVERIVRSELVLDRIAKREKLSVSEESINKGVRDYAQREKLTEQEARAKLEASGGLESSVAERLRNQALGIVLERAKMVAYVPKPRPAAEEGEHPDPGEDASVEDESAADTSGSSPDRDGDA